MIIQAIKQNNNEKLLAIARRLKNGRQTKSVLCDFNTVPGKLRIFWSDSDVQEIDCKNNFKHAIQYIWSIY